MPKNPYRYVGGPALTYVDGLDGDRLWHPALAPRLDELERFAARAAGEAERGLAEAEQALAEAEQALAEAGRTPAKAERALAGTPGGGKRGPPSGPAGWRAPSGSSRPAATPTPQRTPRWTWA